MRNTIKSLIVTAIIITSTLNAFGQSVQRLKVSENKRFLVKADGSPFFYLGDTAWELFHRLNREEADRYLKNRASSPITDLIIKRARLWRRRRRSAREPVAGEQARPAQSCVSALQRLCAIQLRK